MKHDEATLALPGATHRVPHSRSVAGIGFDTASAVHTRRSRQLFGTVDPRTLALYVIVLNVLLMGAGSTALVMTSLGAVSYTHLRAHETREDRGWRRGG